MYGQHVLHRFHFHDEAFFHHNIRSQILVELKAFLFQRYNHLLSRRKALNSQLSQQTFLINRLQQSGT